MYILIEKRPGGITQSVTCLAKDAYLTTDPGVASLIPSLSHTFMEIDHEIISMVILLPSAESIKTVFGSYKRNSLVENKNDLELDFKVFFFSDSCCSDIVHDESNWCHSGIIERFEKLKMASKMAVSYAPNTYLTNRFDKNSSNFNILWMFRG